MKRRKGVTVIGSLAIAFFLIAVACYVVTMLAVDGLKNAFNLENAFDAVIKVFTEFDVNNLQPIITVISTVALWLILAVIWLIVDLKRGRKICFFFVIVYLLATVVDVVYTVVYALPLANAISNAGTLPEIKDAMEYIPLAGTLISGLGILFFVILFIVDIATGRVEKQETPAFIKEPTEEVEEPVYEEVKDENEVKKEETPAPAPVKEEKKEEEAPVEEEKEEQPKEVVPDEDKEEEVVDKAPKAKPVKKQTKKPEAKKAPAKKAEPKKEEKKPAPKKEPAKKAEPKKAAAEPTDARKTGTIVLQNEEGKTYAKAFHVSRRPELNKWQVKATGSDKALKLFNTQKEAIEYANQLAKNQNVSVRVHSKEGKLRKHNG